MNEIYAMRCVRCHRHVPLYRVEVDGGTSGWGEFYCKRCLVDAAVKGEQA